MILHQLEITVVDSSGRPMDDVDIEIRPEAAGESRPAEYDPINQVYFFDGLYPGFFELSLSREPFKPQEARIQVPFKPTEHRFIMVPEDASYTYIGGQRVVYEPKPDLLGIIPVASLEDVDRAAQELKQIFDELRLDPKDSILKVASEEFINTESAPSILRPVIVTRQERPEDPKHDNVLKVLRGNRWVNASGPIFRTRDRGFTVFTHQIVVRFRPEITRAQIESILRRNDLTVSRELTLAPNLFLAGAVLEMGEAINQIIEELVNDKSVDYAEPNLAQAFNFDSARPTDFLWPLCWDRQRVCVEGAWDKLETAHGTDFKYGRPDVIIAIADSGIKSKRGVVEHDDLNGKLSDSRDKIYKLFDFVLKVCDNDQPTDFSPHGVFCAGVASASADNVPTSSSVGNGVVGAAPNTRLMGLISPSLYDLFAESYLWAAGLNVTDPPDRFPQTISPGADILTCSASVGDEAPLPNFVKDMFDAITNWGRKGKGCMALFSAGNLAGQVEDLRPLGSYERSFACAASKVEGGSETHAPYSNHGKHISWCVPSSSVDPAGFDNPPTARSTWTCSFLSEGTAPSLPEVVTTLSKDAKAGEVNITLDITNGLCKMSHLCIGNPGMPEFEVARIVSIGPRGDLVISSQTDISRQGLVRNQKKGEVVISGSSHHIHKFGGTSSAASLSAGICALVLSANPELTWLEAKEILIETAEKIDLTNTNNIGQWLDARDQPICQQGPGGVSCRPASEAVHSKWYGHGRLNADRAVGRALSYKAERDLMIRKTLADTGEKKTLPGDDSPDIWVRNIDPALDCGAIPGGYDRPGLHEDASRNSSRWIYARIKNRGIKQSLDAWARFYLALFDGTPFRYPEDWQLAKGLGNNRNDIWGHGLYFIGEVALPFIQPDGHIIIYLPWAKDLMPPEAVVDAGALMPQIVVELTPQDGPIKGAHLENSNNLAAKSIKINN
jgi:subtilisin family serine protease